MCTMPKPIRTRIVSANRSHRVLRCIFCIRSRNFWSSVSALAWLVFRASLTIGGAEGCVSFWASKEAAEGRTKGCCELEDDGGADGMVASRVKNWRPLGAVLKWAWLRMRPFIRSYFKNLRSEMYENTFANKTGPLGLTNDPTVQEMQIGFGRERGLL